MEKRTILKAILVVSMVLMAVLPGSAWADGTYSGGTGEPNTPYLIATPADMNEIGTHPNDWNNCFLLTADIDLADYNETNFNILGNSTTKFTGVFDGNDHTISNFTWNSATVNYVGLFGLVDDPNAEIKGLRLIDSNVQGYECVGTLVGMFQDGEITDCSIEGGAVSGDYCVGGLAGYNHDTISNCYATGSVAGDLYVGGLAGYNDEADIFDSFWDTETSGQTNGVGYNRGTGTVEVYGRTTTQMQTKTTFTDYGWDFTLPVWKICEGTNYPKLAWQIPLLGDFVCPDGVDFFDFAVFSLAWLSDDTPTGNWNPDCDISDPPDGIIDELDLAVFTDNWLQGL